MNWTRLSSFASSNWPVLAREPAHKHGSRHGRGTVGAGARGCRRGSELRGNAGEEGEGRDSGWSLGAGGGWAGGRPLPAKGG